MRGIHVDFHYPPESEPPARTHVFWREFCGACKGMTLAQIEEASKIPWGTILAWSMDDRVPIDVYAAVRDFPSEKRSP